MAYRMKGGAVANDPRLGRIPSFDERSRKFAVRELVPDKPVVSKAWRLTYNLDQGETPQCVGYSAEQTLHTPPLKQRIFNSDQATEIYNLARQLDEWPGEDYDGSSVLGGAKAVKQLGFISEYRWGFGIKDTVMALCYTGPVVFGINWYNDMFDPDSKGFVIPEGGVAGGHAIECNAIRPYFKAGAKTRFFDDLDMDRSYVRLTNSWGNDWGLSGNCYLTLTDLDKLLNEQGEACFYIK